MDANRSRRCFSAPSAVGQWLSKEQRAAARAARTSKPAAVESKRRSKVAAINWTDEQKKEAAALVEQGMTRTAVAKKFGVSQSFISNVVAAERRRKENRK